MANEIYWRCGKEESRLHTGDSSHCDRCDEFTGAFYAEKHCIEDCITTLTKRLRDAEKRIAELEKHEKA